MSYIQKGGFLAEKCIWKSLARVWRAVAIAILQVRRLEGVSRVNKRKFISVLLLLAHEIREKGDDLLISSSFRDRPLI
jgi:hypothetical protein